jgi:hypothetical protein
MGMQVAIWNALLYPDSTRTLQSYSSNLEYITHTHVIRLKAIFSKHRL